MAAKTGIVNAGIAVGNIDAGMLKAKNLLQKLQKSICSLVLKIGGIGFWQLFKGLNIPIMGPSG